MAVTEVPCKGVNTTFTFSRFPDCANTPLSWYVLGIAFALGRQDDIRFEAAKRGWLTEFPNFNQAYTTVHNNEISYNASN